MRRVLVALVLALSAVPIPRVAWGQSCGGVERWAVKVGSDSRAAAIDLTNRVTTAVHDLVHLPRPTLPSDDTTRLNEERTIRVVDARLVQFKTEAGKTGDSDFHLVKSDDTLQFSTTNVSPHSFVAEIVDPGCVAGRHDQVSFPSLFQAQLEAVHATFVDQFGSTIQTDGSWNDGGGIPVRITGIGFFDRIHVPGQTGRALNGIELHPLLDIEFNPRGPTPTPTPSALPQNPGFESGGQGWTATPGVISNDPNQPAHSGTFDAWLGGYGEVHTDRLSQSVALPATRSGVSLTFFLHIITEEQTTTQPFDTLRVQVRRPNGQTTTLKTFSNLQAGDGYTQQTFNLTPFRGETVQIQLVAIEDNGSMTSFVVDDFAIVSES